MRPIVQRRSAGMTKARLVTWKRSQWAAKTAHTRPVCIFAGEQSCSDHVPRNASFFSTKLFRSLGKTTSCRIQLLRSLSKTTSCRIQLSKSLGKTTSCRIQLFRSLGKTTSCRIQLFRSLDKTRPCRIQLLKSCTKQRSLASPKKQKSHPTVPIMRLKTLIVRSSGCKHLLSKDPTHTRAESPPRHFFKRRLKCCSSGVAGMNACVKKKNLWILHTTWFRVLRCGQSCLDTSVYMVEKRKCRTGFSVLHFSLCNSSS